jgi:hypothetical protein
MAAVAGMLKWAARLLFCSLTEAAKQALMLQMA